MLILSSSLPGIPFNKMLHRNQGLPEAKTRWVRIVHHRDTIADLAVLMCLRPDVAHSYIESTHPSLQLRRDAETLGRGPWPDDGIGLDQRGR